MNPKQRSRGRGNNGNPNRIHSGGHGGHGGGHGGGGGGGGGPRHINVRTQVFDSNGPEGRIRGNAHQVMEKYLALARDASSQGDRVAAENFYQHAEHYFRLINAYNQNNGQRRPQNLPTPAEDQNDMTCEDEDGEENASVNVAPVGSDMDENPVAAAVAEVAPEPQPEPRAERAERAERTERAERSAERAERGERSERAERPARPRRTRQPAPAPVEAEDGSPSEPVNV